MDKRYVELFKDLAKATAVSAEQVMDYDSQKGDNEGLATATTMRDDFQELTDRINDTDYVITKADAAKLLVGSMIIANQIKDKIESLQKGLAGYQTDLIPKLEEVLGAETEEEAQKTAEEKFSIKETNT